MGLMMTNENSDNSILVSDLLAAQPVLVANWMVKEKQIL